MAKLVKLHQSDGTPLAPQRLFLAGLLALLLLQSLPALATDDCPKNLDLISWIDCVATLPEYSRQSGSYPARIHKLLKRSPLTATNAAGDSALSVAARYGLAEIATSLLKLGANPKHRNHQGETPLLLAIKGLTSVDETRGETLAVLLKYGARVDTADSQGTTPLMLATQAAPSVKIETLKLILSRKPKVWALDAKGEHALFYLIRSYQPAMAGEDWIWEAFREASLLLLAHKPDLGIRNRDGQTVLDLARSLDFTLMVDLLKAQPQPSSP
ncbi:MAG: hypothetical protein CVV27_13270 [Candidatus Melainabacteria bacterium HGW-Melainabacteria-1]|nr:MAG: hypothetical protein CVV27_13270 [Candidatus Melainabacteria bacterium HGW-Melainabacteria-1]